MYQEFTRRQEEIIKQIVWEALDAKLALAIDIELEEKVMPELREIRRLLEEIARSKNPEITAIDDLWTI